MSIVFDRARVVKVLVVRDRLSVLDQRVVFVPE